ncbi:hypothetical protein MPH_00601 [Macrophomina phaseolina MS6]|uniref:Uncharacterized protein n=1 Tax=Macrophomina phaseolina (strain MS6) TaxID=1126212 RepID=K2SZG2_MACPH|nr:hypothetical protein MPH_00601 [Macrophomina phaseolina MS6]
MPTAAFPRPGTPASTSNPSTLSSPRTSTSCSSPFLSPTRRMASSAKTSSASCVTARARRPASSPLIVIRPRAGRVQLSSISRAARSSISRRLSRHYMMERSAARLST